MKFTFHAHKIFLSSKCIFLTSYLADNKTPTKSSPTECFHKGLLYFF